jgi:hypothetical protein
MWLLRQTAGRVTGRRAGPLTGRLSRPTVHRNDLRRGRGHERGYGNDNRVAAHRL